MAREEDVDLRLRRVIGAEYGFLWRSLKRLGVPDADLDDGAQRVLSVFARRIKDIAPGSERSFMFQSALHVASEMRRTAIRSRLSNHDEAAHQAVDEGAWPDEILEQRQARKFLSEALDRLELDQRAVFVLFELEELSTAQIAEVLNLPPGTVSSRLRRAREEFRKITERLQKRAVLPTRES